MAHRSGNEERGCHVMKGMSKLPAWLGGRGRGGEGEGGCNMQVMRGNHLEALPYPCGSLTQPGVLDLALYLSDSAPPPKPVEEKLE